MYMGFLTMKRKLMDSKDVSKGTLCILQTVKHICKSPTVHLLIRDPMVIIFFPVQIRTLTMINWLQKLITSMYSTISSILVYYSLKKLGLYTRNVMTI